MDFSGGQWLRLHTPNARGLGWILGQGTRSHVPLLRVGMLQLKTLHAIVKIEKHTYHN